MQLTRSKVRDHGNRAAYDPRRGSLRATKTCIDAHLSIETSVISIAQEVNEKEQESQRNGTHIKLIRLVPLKFLPIHEPIQFHRSI